MAGRITEMYRNCRFRLLSVTEIILTPFRGRIFSAVVSGDCNHLLVMVSNGRAEPFRPVLAEKYGRIRDAGNLAIAACDRRDVSRELQEGKQ
jgi:hypothetical protein